MRILVVDSEPLVLRVFEQMLAAEGHDVSVLLMADAGDAKAPTWMAAKADVVLLGIVMMACDGPMLASSIRKRFPAVRIVASGTLLEMGAEMVRIGAADAFLPRSFGLDQLRAAIGTGVAQ